MNTILDDFFSHKTENKINKELLYCKDHSTEVGDYVQQLINVPLSEYVEYVRVYYTKQPVASKDVVQFSSFEDATYEICLKLKQIDNPGLKFLDIGKLLLDDGKERKDGAYVKYGENHAKTATVLGLLFEFYNTFYLSCIGIAYLELSESDRNKLLCRLIIRSKLVSRTLQASENGKVSMRDFLYMLSESTYIRRKSNVKKMIDYLYRSDEYNFKTLIELIEF